MALNKFTVVWTYVWPNGIEETQLASAPTLGGAQEMIRPFRPRNCQRYTIKAGRKIVERGEFVAGGYE